MTGLFDDPAAFFAALVLKIPALLFAVTVHEVAHGWVADRLGDPTARQQGRLTLNPFPHLDPVGALAFIIAGFGWAKPVPVDPSNLRRPGRDMALVGGAGPAANFVTAFLGLVALMVVRRAGMPAGLADPLGGILVWTFQFNLALGIFNLIPVPPLDGGHFLPYLLPRSAAQLVWSLERWGPLILLALVVSGAARVIVGPVFALLVHVYVATVRLLFSVV